jgi:hypothetical protein
MGTLALTAGRVHGEKQQQISQKSVKIGSLTENNQCEEVFPEHELISGCKRVSSTSPCSNGISSTCTRMGTEETTVGRVHGPRKEQIGQKCVKICP